MVVGTAAPSGRPRCVARVNRPEDPAIEAIRRSVTSWAQREPLIRSVWLFGSRARGDHRPDSDLDLAISHDIDPTVLAQAGHRQAAARVLTRMDCRGRWADALTQRFDFPVQLESLDRGDTIVRPAVLRDGVLLYRRGRIMVQPALA